MMSGSNIVSLIYGGARHALLSLLACQIVGCPVEIPSSETAGSFSSSVNI